MRGVNKVTLVGNLGTDVELRYLPSGMSVCNFTLATNETWEKDGERQEKTEWHRIVAFGKLAELCSQLLVKGALVYVEGKIQTRAWEDREGQKKYTTEIVVREMNVLSPKGDKEADGGGGKAPEPPQEPKEAPESKDQDLPF